MSFGVEQNRWNIAYDHSSCFRTKEELDELFEAEGFSVEAHHVDRRLIVNRAKQVKMHRVWLQAKYKKKKEEEEVQEKAETDDEKEKTEEEQVQKKAETVKTAEEEVEKVEEKA